MSEQPEDEFFLLRSGREGGIYNFTPTRSPIANSTIGIIATLPKTSRRDHLLTALEMLGNASDKDLSIWRALVADPRSPLPHEFPADLSKETLKNIILVQIDERRRMKDNKRVWWQLIVGCLITFGLSVATSLILGK